MTTKQTKPKSTRPKRNPKLELNEQQKQMLANFTQLEQMEIIKRFVALRTRRKRDLSFYQPIDEESIIKKINSLEKYYIKDISRVIAEDYLLPNKDNPVKTKSKLYWIIKDHLIDKTKLQVTEKFIESVIEHLYEKAGYLHIKGLLPTKNADLSDLLS